MILPSSGSRSAKLSWVLRTAPADAGFSATSANARTSGSSLPRGRARSAAVPLTSDRDSRPLVPGRREAAGRSSLASAAASTSTGVSRPSTTVPVRSVAGSSPIARPSGSAAAPSASSVVAPSATSPPSGSATGASAPVVWAAARRKPRRLVSRATSVRSTRSRRGSRRAGGLQRAVEPRAAAGHRLAQAAGRRAQPAARLRVEDLQRLVEVDGGPGARHAQRAAGLDAAARPALLERQVLAAEDRHRAHLGAAVGGQRLEGGVERQPQARHRRPAAGRSTAVTSWTWPTRAPPMRTSSPFTSWAASGTSTDTS